jgi:uncharacterized membrane protein
VTREELVERLAAVSHRTWMRQKEEDLRAALENISPEVTDHDRERASATVAELEVLGLLKPFSD